MRLVGTHSPTRHLAAWLLCGLVVMQPSAALSAERFTAPAVANWAGELGAFGPVLLGLLIALEALLAPIPGWFLTAATGLLYGFWPGLALAWVSAMVGSIAAFAVARRFGRQWLLRKVPNSLMRLIDTVSRDDGFLILLTARIVPFTALDILSYAAGLSHMRFTTFALATGLGLLPGTVALVAAGAEMQSLKRPDRVIYIVLLLVIIYQLAARFVRKYRSRRKIT